MTQDERNMLTDLANKIAQTPAPPRDPEAEDFIRKHIGSRPDALYLMTQTVLIQNLALQHAQQQIHDLEQRSSQPAQVSSGSGFLGQPASPSRGQQYAPPPPPSSQYAGPYQSAPTPSGAPSFLRGAAQTAAGVAAGALAFEGIRSLFSHPGYGGGGFGGFGGGGFMGGGAPVEETVVNNYYDSPQDTSRDDSQTADQGADSAAGNDVLNADDSSQYDDPGQYDDASNYDAGDIGGFDDNSGGDSFV